MIRRCCSAGTPCLREAVLTARVAGNGDIALCRECFDKYVALAMDIREIEPAPVPEWLRRGGLARDETGRVLRGAA